MPQGWGATGVFYLPTRSEVPEVQSWGYCWDCSDNPQTVISLDLGHDLLGKLMISECPASAPPLHLGWGWGAREPPRGSIPWGWGRAAQWGLIAAGSPPAPQPPSSWQGEFDALQNMEYIDLFSRQQTPKPCQLMWLQKVKYGFGVNYQLPTNVLCVVWNADTGKEGAQGGFLGAHMHLSRRKLCPLCSVWLCVFIRQCHPQKVSKNRRKTENVKDRK